jgi:hypothetical protein
VGLPLGFLLAIAARAGPWRKRTAKSLVTRIVILLAVIVSCALAAGLVGFLLAKRGQVVLWQPLAQQVPEEKHAAFLANALAHSVSYFVGIVGALILAAGVLMRRIKSLGSEPYLAEFIQSPASHTSTHPPA